MIIWVIAGLLGLATGLRIGWALVNKQSLVSAAMIVALGSLGLVAALNWEPLTLLLDTILHWPNVSSMLSQVALIACAAGSCVMITSASSRTRTAFIVISSGSPGPTPTPTRVGMLVAAEAKRASSGVRA